MMFNNPIHSISSFSQATASLSLALVATLKAVIRKFFAVLAIKCSSWTPVNRGTSNRSACASIGHEDYTSVSDANTMAARFLGS